VKPYAIENPYVTTQRRDAHLAMSTSHGLLRTAITSRDLNATIERIRSQAVQHLRISQFLSPFDTPSSRLMTLLNELMRTPRVDQLHGAGWEDVEWFFWKCMDRFPDNPPALQPSSNLPIHWTLFNKSAELFPIWAARLLLAAPDGLNADGAAGHQQNIPESLQNLLPGVKAHVTEFWFSVLDSQSEKTVHLYSLLRGRFDLALPCSYGRLCSDLHNKIHSTVLESYAVDTLSSKNDIEALATLSALYHLLRREAGMPRDMVWHSFPVLHAKLAVAAFAAPSQRCAALDARPTTRE
jgi:hypothetical protein